MKLFELKNWLNTLPEEFMEYDVVNAEEGLFGAEDSTYYRLDKPVTALNVNMDTKEVLILNQPKTENFSIS